MRKETSVKKKVSRKRPVEMRMRVSEKEAKQIKDKMDKLGLRNREAYLRKMALEGYVIMLDLPGLREMTKELHACGNNLNQIARRVNSDGGLFAADMAALKNQFDDINGRAEKILSSLAVLQE